MPEFTTVPLGRVERRVWNGGGGLRDSEPHGIGNHWLRFDRGSIGQITGRWCAWDGCDYTDDAAMVSDADRYANAARSVADTFVHRATSVTS